MGKHSKKPRGPSTGYTRDIGQLLSHGCRPKMADVLPELGLDSHSALEDNYLSNVPTPTPQWKSQALPPRQREHPLATKVDLSAMVNDLKAFLTAEL
ncbi:Hypothetical predicted protein [Pelobates cultripes]|uniref:Uncharacterized protein n=1 Tax=Pelobates cultripes TaxID=61616 RepID=A0AAD1RGX1_PELCU|nr:Hypothetical predicted protein [Pelobates cultripes]